VRGDGNLEQKETKSNKMQDHSKMPVLSLDSLSVLTSTQKQHLASAGLLTVQDILTRELPVKGVKLPELKNKVRQACNIPLAICSHSWFGLTCHVLVPAALVELHSQVDGDTVDQSDQKSLGSVASQKASDDMTTNGKGRSKVGKSPQQQRLVRGTIGAILLYPKSIRVQFKLRRGGSIERSGIYLLAINRLWISSEVLSDEEEDDGKNTCPTNSTPEIAAAGVELPRLQFLDEVECKDFSVDDLSRLRDYQWECNSLFDISKKLTLE